MNRNIIRRIERLEKKFPMKPIHKGHAYMCAICGNYLVGTHREARRKKCDRCGQTIDWTEE